MRGAGSKLTKLVIGISPVCGRHPQTPEAPSSGAGVAGWGSARGYRPCHRRFPGGNRRWSRPGVSNLHRLAEQADIGAEARSFRAGLTLDAATSIPGQRQRVRDIGEAAEPFHLRPHGLHRPRRAACASGGAHFEPDRLARFPAPWIARRTCRAIPGKSLVISRISWAISAAGRRASQSISFELDRADQFRILARIGKRARNDAVDLPP